MWRARKAEVRKAKRMAEEEERKKKGALTGREIFMQVHAGEGGAKILMPRGAELGRRAQRSHAGVAGEGRDQVGGCKGLSRGRRKVMQQLGLKGGPRGWRRTA